jgi:UDP-N-acetylmuramate-alanine ligase
VTDLGRIRLNLPGMHNVYNAMASIAVGLELNMSFDLIKEALERPRAFSAVWKSRVTSRGPRLSTITDTIPQKLRPP